MELAAKTFLDEIIESITLSKVLIGLLIIVVGSGVLIAFRIAFRKIRTNSAFTDDKSKLTALTVSYHIIRVVVAFLIILLVLSAFGVNVNSFIAGIGLMSAVIGIGLQDFLKDIFSGFLILFDKYFQIGDAVEYNGKDGIVIAFNIRTTKIEYLDDRSVISVANRNISQIRRLTHLVDIDVPLSYDEDRKTVFRVMTEIAHKISETDGVENCVFKGTQDFSESAIIYKIRFFCEPNDRPDIRREVLRIIQDELAENGIRIPYKQIDIHSK